jgi:3-hydroxyisobutyrate dehydrogenase
MADPRVPEQLTALLEEIWSRLAAGVDSASHPFHTPCLATAGPRGADARTVVLRRSDPALRRIACHTDARSPKVADIGEDDRVTWVFYDARDRVQLRAWGRTRVHRDGALAEEQWSKSGPRGRRCYLSAGGPGSELASPGSGLPAELEARPPTIGESRAGRVHFVVLECDLEEMDWLALDGRGHRRARLTWDGSAWQRVWITP